MRRRKQKRKWRRVRGKAHPMRTMLMRRWMNPYSRKAKYIHKRLRSPRKFARGSMRTISIGGRKKMVVGCPKHHWDKRRRRCRVGMRGQSILMPKYANNPRRRRKIKIRKAWRRGMWEIRTGRNELLRVVKGKRYAQKIAKHLRVSMDAPKRELREHGW